MTELEQIEHEEFEAFEKASKELGRKILVVLAGERHLEAFNALVLVSSFLLSVAPDESVQRHSAEHMIASMNALIDEMTPEGQTLQ